MLELLLALAGTLLLISAGRKRPVPVPVRAKKR